MKNILFYQFGAPNEKEFEAELVQLKMPFVKLRYEMKDYHADAQFAQLFLTSVHTNEVDVVFSYDYFPLISMLCEMNHLPYMAWIFDSPLTTLQSKTLTNDCNYIFCFDRLYTERLRGMGAKHCIHFPLGVRSNKLFSIEKNILKDGGWTRQFMTECSFVGSLYNEAKNRIRHSNFSAYTKGYIEGIMRAQSEVYGYNFVYSCLCDKVVSEIIEKCDLYLSDYYITDQKQLVTNAINKELAAREREMVLKVLSDFITIDLYTGSSLPTELAQKNNLRNKGYVDYDKQMPYIFNQSRININITSRSIESGISLRVLDILSVGGFCITNYQPEIAEYFEDGREIVMYTGMQDLVDKVKYYSQHAKKRDEIARNGYVKVQQCFALAPKIQEMLDVVRRG